MDTDRRTTLAGFGAALMLAASSPAQAESSDPKGPPGAALAELSELLRKAPRLRDFKSVPMILENPDFWDSELLIEVQNYKGAYKQAWDNTQIAGSWLNGMRNSLNSQVFSFRHPDFLVVSATHGPAHLALYDQQMWDKYKLADLAGGTFKTNTLIERKHTSSDGHNPKDPHSLSRLARAGRRVHGLPQRHLGGLRKAPGEERQSRLALA